MKKKTGIIIGVILLFVVIIVGIVYYYDNVVYPKQVLENEVLTLSTLDLTKDTVDMNIKAKGKYGEVEKAIKTYLSEYSIESKKIISIMSDERYSKVLSIDNYKEDGKEFTSTKAYLAQTKSDLEDSFDKLITMTSTENMSSYIDPNLGQQYVDLYEYYMFDQEISKELESAKTSLEEAKTTIDNTLYVYENVINLLSNNQNSWIIQGENIVFSTQELLDQYNELTLKL